MKQQTAVEWLVNLYYTEYGILLPSEDFSEAKQMEKKQIIDAYLQGCFDEGLIHNNPNDYYNKKFNAGTGETEQQ